MLQNLAAGMEAATTVNIKLTSREILLVWFWVWGFLGYLMIQEQESVSIESVPVVVSNAHYFHFTVFIIY